jgi:hypothetical protein
MKTAVFRWIAIMTGSVLAAKEKELSGRVAWWAAKAALNPILILNVHLDWDQACAIFR